jgi:predicted nucleotidyltransferase
MITGREAISNIMGKKKISEILRSCKKEFAEQYDLLDIGVFGSVARDEIGEDSDVDVVVRISKPDLFMLVGIKNELEERLHRSVDIVTYRKNMNQFLKKRIDGEAVYA